MRKHNLAFIDLETTGLDPIKHEIIEIGCVLTDRNFKILEEFDLKIKPENIENADKTSLKINHFNEADWASAYSLKEALKIFSKKVQNCIMIGHNVTFDSSFLERAFIQAGIKNLMHYHKLDTISIAWAKLHQEADLDHFSLRELCLYFKIENKNAHSALSDARAAFELYKKLINL